MPLPSPLVVNSASIEPSLNRTTPAAPSKSEKAAANCLRLRSDRPSASSLRLSWSSKIAVGASFDAYMVRMPGSPARSVQVW
jgi:hypothetical protein